MSNQELFSQGGAGLVANALQTTCHDYSRADGFNMVVQPMAFGFLPGQGDKSGSIGYQMEQRPTLRAGCDNYGVHCGMAVRRLTPKECERLQGFPDNYTAIPWKNKPADQCPDGPRYKALGNSMAVPVMRWIGQRIELVESVCRELGMEKTSSDVCGDDKDRH